MISVTTQRNITKFLLLVIIVILPFSISDRSIEVNSPRVTNSTVGFFQTNTCQYSLANFAINNLQNEKVVVKNDFSSSIKCFGKVNGVDIVGENYFVYIGTNLTLNLIIQSLFWLLLLSFIPRNTNNVHKASFIKLLLISLLFSIQIFSEKKFYDFYNKQYSDSFSLDNYFFLSILTGYIVVLILCNEIVSSRLESFINFFPFLFLITGTFSSANINFIMILIILFAINNLNRKTLSSAYSKLYFLLIVIWIFNNTKVETFFDVDKLRGFVNSSNSNLSLIFWAIVIYLFIYGLNIMMLSSVKKLDIIKLKNSFLISGSLVLILGILGAKNSYFNFFNFYFFGQNKTGMNTFDSVAGNTWRGFASSAEAVGEFYGVIILFSLFSIWKLKKIYSLDVLFLAINMYGLYRANDVAVMITLLFILGYFLIFSLSKSRNIKIKYTLAFCSIAFSLLIALFIQANPGTSKDYNFLSENLLAQSIKSSEYFTVNNPEIENFLNGSNYLDIKKIDTSNNILSNSTVFLIERYHPRFNIPVIPNPASTLSIVSSVINRTEKWGYFVAKYNPNLIQLLFGNGPSQLNNYYFGHKVAINDGLILPHSSLLDILIYFGLLGVIFICFLLFKILSTLNNNIFNLIALFLYINFLKSDSILYISSLLLIYVIINLSLTSNEEQFSYE